jgi:asparagine synthase (glutamine-hydrolysing)
MCGISGIINFDGTPVVNTDLDVMIKTMKHRGPDDDGVFVDNNIGLGFVRLSILDLSLDGHQPMISKEDNLVIVFNGEIYNYIELKEELKNDFSFKSKTDTEVILKAYKKWGKNFLHKLNGMFAFAIYNIQTKEIFIARDRFGVKPFYYYYDKNKFVFCSEITPILKVVKNINIPDNQSIYDFLIYNRTNHTENTFFKKIKKIQHGHSITISENGMSVEKWYDLEKEILKKKYTDFSKEAFLDLFKSSIELRMRSDVPVGACLSGGLDSSAIVSTILKYFNTSDFNTFSAVYNKGERGDESAYINYYKPLIQKMHFTHPTSDDFLNAIDNFIEALQEPVPGTSAFAEYKVYELAKKHVTVILNGQGADEALAGYIYFAGFYYKELFKSFRWWKLLKEMLSDYKNHKILEGPMSFIFFMMPLSLKDWISKKNITYINKEFASNYKGDTSFLKHLYGSDNLHESLVKHFEYKFEHHLIWGDRSSMWHSMEARFPFLDYRLVEYMLSLPTEKVLNNGVTKVILRESMEGMVPEAIRLRMEKIGYETPEDKWFRDKKVIDFALQIFNDKRTKERGYINTQEAIAMLNKHVSSKKSYAMDLWKAIHLELWFRKFIDEN